MYPNCAVFELFEINYLRCKSIIFKSFNRWGLQSLFFFYKKLTINRNSCILIITFLLCRYSLIFRKFLLPSVITNQKLVCKQTIFPHDSLNFFLLLFIYTIIIILKRNIIYISRPCVDVGLFGPPLALFSPPALRTASHYY